MIWRSIQYDWPRGALLIFLVLGIAWGIFSLYRYRQNKLKNVADDSVLAQLMEKRQPALFWMKSFCICLAWICGVVALMQPKGNERYAKVTPSIHEKTALEKGAIRKKMQEVILLIDASASMSISDAAGGRTREQVAKEIGDEVISLLKGENVSLFAFTSATIQLVPSTNDYLFARIMLRQLEINEGETAGTDIKQALETVRKSYFDSLTPIPKTLIFISDGGDTHYESLQGDARQHILADILHPIEDASENNLQLLVVGVGSKQGGAVPGITYEGHQVTSALNETLLRKMSIVGQGETMIVDEMSTQQVAQAIARKIAARSIYEEVPADLTIPSLHNLVYDFYYQVPLGLAILFLLMILVIPDTTTRLLNKRAE